MYDVRYRTAVGKIISVFDSGQYCTMRLLSGGGEIKTPLPQIEPLEREISDTHINCSGSETT
jgi:hypothetical protein